MYNTQCHTARKLHGFSVGVEIDLVVVWVVEIDMISVWRIGVDLISVWGSELTLFVWRSKMRWFGVWIEINLIFVSRGVQN